MSTINNDRPHRPIGVWDRVSFNKLDTETHRGARPNHPEFRHHLGVWNFGVTQQELRLTNRRPWPGPETRKTLSSKDKNDIIRATNQPI